MPRIIELNDPDAPGLACYADLRHAPAQVDSFIVEGRWCVQRLIESRHEVLSVVVERGKESHVVNQLSDHTTVYSLPADQIRHLVGFDFHRGVLACGRRPVPHSIDQLRFGSELPALALAVLGVSEKENLGSMMRTSAALGVENVLIGPRTADPYSRRAVRVSMATALQLKFHSLDYPLEQLNELQAKRNLRTVVTTLDPAATPLHEFVPDKRESIVVVGNEATGVDPAVERIATDRVTIPLRMGTDSLNVSIAAAIVLYEMLQGRG